MNTSGGSTPLPAYITIQEAHEMEYNIVRAYG